MRDIPVRLMHGVVVIYGYLWDAKLFIWATLEEHHSSPTSRGRVTDYPKRFNRAFTSDTPYNHEHIFSLNIGNIALLAPSWSEAS